MYSYTPYIGKQTFVRLLSAYLASRDFFLMAIYCGNSEAPMNYCNGAVGLI